MESVLLETYVIGKTERGIVKKTCVCLACPRMVVKVEIVLPDAKHWMANDTFQISFLLLEKVHVPKREIGSVQPNFPSMIVQISNNFSHIRIEQIIITQCKSPT